MTLVALLLAIGVHISSGGEVPNSPLTPDQEAKKFQLADDALTIELVASEPNVIAPVAIAWDADGRMFVAEMTDYPSGPISGRIRILEDRDGDGRYERAMVFADKLPFPNGVMPWQGGVLVTAAPDIWYLSDTNGDGVADVRQKLLTGFAEGNQQLRVNGLFWGLDNWIYGANGRSDGEVRWADGAPTNNISIRRRDFRFQPGSRQLEAVAGNSQFGLAHDDWGNRFPVFNNIPLRHVVIEDGYLARQPLLGGAENVPGIAPPDDTGKVFGLVPPVLLIPQPPGFFTSACGSSIYRGDWLGPKYRGNAFICEATQNLVTRRLLRPAGPTFVAERPEQGREFLASTDPWFHGVFTATGPDGAFYVVDFYRKYVEHPHWVAEGLRDKVPWREGEQHGRIWRIRPKDSKPKVARPNLARAGAAELVKHLGDENGWWRDTVQRLLVERQQRSAIPALAKMARRSPSPLARLQALHTLEGLPPLNPELLLTALNDPSPGVRELAIRLSESLLRSGAAPVRRQFESKLPRLVEDLDSRVRYQLALSLGEIEVVKRLPALARLADTGASDRWQTLAILSSLGPRPWLFLKMLQTHPWLDLPDAAQAQFLEKLAALIGAERKEGDWAEFLAWLTQPASEPAASLVLLAGFADGLSQGNTSLRQLLRQPPAALPQQAGALDRLLHKAAETAVAGQAPLPSRLAAARLLGKAEPVVGTRPLLELLRPEHPVEVQSAGVRALIELNDSAAAVAIFADWDRCAKSARKQIVSAASRSAKWATALLDAVEQGRVLPIEVDPSTRQALAKSQNAEIRRRAESAFKTPTAPDREGMVQSLRPALQMAGDSGRGAAVFTKACLVCHAIQGKGNRVGPDLSGVWSRSKETLLVDVFDPSRQVLPDYMSYTLVTADGESLTGVVAAESGSSVTLRSANAADLTVPRRRIKELKADGKSLMPDGLEQGLSPQDVADLLEFLQRPDARLLPDAP